jgi:hypothetical protein
MCTPRPLADDPCLCAVGRLNLKEQQLAPEDGEESDTETRKNLTLEEEANRWGPIVIIIITIIIIIIIIVIIVLLLLIIIAGARRLWWIAADDAHQVTWCRIQNLCSETGQEASAHVCTLPLYSG